MDKRKHISLIYEFLSEQGGLERELINHARFLIEKGYDVDILTCHLDERILKLLPFEGIPVRTISTIKTPIESLNMVLCFLGFNNLNQHNPDLFISYSAPCNYLLRNKQTKKVNYINHFPHFLYLKGKDKIEWASSTQGIKRWIAVLVSWLFGNHLRKFDKKLLLKNDLNVVNSEYTRKRLSKIYGTDFLVSYPPVDPKFKPADLKLNEKFIFSSSRIIPDKKYEWLIQALSHLKQKMPLYIAGSVNDSYKTSLLSLAKENNVQIRFLGKLTTDQIVKYYSNASVFAFPAPKEDFGLVPAESLSCGTPVVAWGDGAGPTEQIIEGINGYLARPYELQDFADKIELCIKNNIKQRNKKRILDSAKKFSFDEIKKWFVREIERIL